MKATRGGGDKGFDWALRRLDRWNAWLIGAGECVRVYSEGHACRKEQNNKREFQEREEKRSTQSPGDK